MARFEHTTVLLTLVTTLHFRSPGCIHPAQLHPCTLDQPVSIRPRPQLLITSILPSTSEFSEIMQYLPLCVWLILLM